MATFRSILPPNTLLSERALEQATAEPVIALETDAARQAKNAATCPAQLLPWLAWEYAVDYWDPGWTDAQKRQVIKDSPYVHQHRGTAGAVRRALSSVGYPTTVIEWWQETPKGDPYTFRIEVYSDEAVSDELYSRIRRQVDGAKNLRSWLTVIDVMAEVGGSGAMYIGGAVTMNIDIDIPAG
ncbi:phage tail protein I [Erwinia endophytica]|uniref:phage tail protein I n=1 Tax=Erwinia endophytica TaxID=1563158 RepID=UPI001265DBE2|nr:phage tail protein I [Erwinia endophytica]KAB8307270.1 phage tail protein I [Erwinia endophytica]